jgi:hypothetical protein
MRATKFCLIGLLLAFVTGCANGFLSVAETPAQKGYAIERAYNIVLEDALQIASAPTTSASIRDSIQNAEARTTPVIDSLSDSLVLYEVERAKVAAGQGTAERLTVIATNLENWVAQAQTALITLQAAFRN